MINEEIVKKTAILVGIYKQGNEKKCERSLVELALLAQTLDIEPVTRVMQLREKPDNKYFTGKGKLQEIVELVSSNNLDYIVFDDELSPLQTKKISELTDAIVIDRTSLILEIFSKRATTKEGIIQVEIATLRYKLSHQTNQGKELSRLGAGIGTRGPGETKREVTRRTIRDKISSLKRELKAIDSQKELLRTSKKRQNYFVVALVGYTNAGKSTLLNKLTNENVLAKDMLFATLDSTARVLELPEGSKMMLIDTIGFINKLPHDLISAFKSTLDDIKYADMLLHVVDISDEDASLKSQVVYDTLDNILDEKKEIICINNKCDSDVVYKVADDRSIKTFDVSARTGSGLDDLCIFLEEKLRQRKMFVSFLIPYEKGELVSKIRNVGEITKEEFTEKGTAIDCYLEEKYINVFSLERYIIK